MLYHAVKQQSFGSWALLRIMGVNNEIGLAHAADEIIRCFSVGWRGYPLEKWHPADHSLSIVKAGRGCCKGQTAFEFLTLFMCDVTFGDVLADTGALIRGTALVPSALP